MNNKNIIALLIGILSMFYAVCASAMGIATWTHRYGNLTDVVTDNEEITWVRDIAEWADFEKTKGEIVIPDDFRERYYTLKQEGKSIVMVLAYGNALYSGSDNVVMPTESNIEYFEAWLRYVRTMVTEFKDVVNHFEVWNEPNLSYANSNATAAEYGYLFKETKKVIEDISPNAVVIGGAIAYARSHERFTTNFYNNGGSEMDGFSFHLYVYGKTPEAGWEEYIGYFENYITRLGYNGPLWLTETGYITGENEVALSEKEQAAYLIRLQALWDNYLKNRDREGKIFWFFANDWGNDRSSVSPNHGVLTSNGAKKESYYSLKALNSLLSGKTMVDFSKDSNSYKAHYVNDKTKDELYILWNSADEECTQSITADCDEMRVYSYKGELLETITDTENVRITADGAPKMVECVNNSTIISSVDFIPSKRAVRIFGKCNFSNTVTIEVEKEGAVVDTVTATVTDEKFNKEFYTSSDGECIIYAGRKEAGSEYLYDSRVITFEKYEEAKGSIDTMSIVTDNATVSISGTVSNMADGERLSVMVIPEELDTASLNQLNIAYISETVVKASGFTHTFEMPQNSNGKYKVFVSTYGADVISETADISTQSQLVGVYDLDAEKSERIYVSTYLNNPASSLKEARLVIAHYNADGRLLGTETQTVMVDAYTVLPVQYTVTAEAMPDEKEVKAFIFDGEKQLMPLISAVTAK